MFHTIIKTYQTQYSAKNWQRTIRTRAIAKNHYRVTGDVKKTRAFINSVAMYKPHTHFAKHKEHVIFSYEGLALATKPAYMFVH